MVNRDANLLSWKYAQNSSNSLRFISIFNKNYKHILLEEIIAYIVGGECLIDFPKPCVSKKYLSPTWVDQAKLFVDYNCKDNKNINQISLYYDVREAKGIVPGIDRTIGN